MKRQIAVAGILREKIPARRQRNNVEVSKGLIKALQLGS